MNFLVLEQSNCCEDLLLHQLLMFHSQQTESLNVWKPLLCLPHMLFPSFTVLWLLQCFSAFFLRNMQRHKTTTCQFQPQFASIPGQPCQTVVQSTHRDPIPDGTSMHSLVCLRRIHPRAHQRPHTGIKKRLKTSIICTLSHNHLLNHTPWHTFTHTSILIRPVSQQQPSVLLTLPCDYIISHFIDLKAS